ncbi:MAG: hypothetical protein HF973_12380 [Chloroflexi bacterium]|nr:hypothetical protein [Chloroflexota bacterium]
MSKQITLTLPEPVYQRAQQVATSTHRDVREVLSEALAQTFRPFPVDENRELMLREIEAFRALHPQLVKQYMGKYVAIYQGAVVDDDHDPVALLKRINQKYPDKVVLRRKVEKDPDPVLYFRSPRFAQ